MPAWAIDDDVAVRSNNYDNAMTWAVDAGIKVTRRLSIDDEFARTNIDMGYLALNMNYRFGAR